MHLLKGNRAHSLKTSFVAHRYPISISFRFLLCIPRSQVRSQYMTNYKFICIWHESSFSEELYILPYVRYMGHSSTIKTIFKTNRYIFKKWSKQFGFKLKIWTFSLWLGFFFAIYGTFHTKSNIFPDCSKLLLKLFGKIELKIFNFSFCLFLLYDIIHVHRNNSCYMPEMYVKILNWN